jgi:hypothetical protein
VHKRQPCHPDKLVDHLYSYNDVSDSSHGTYGYDGKSRYNPESLHVCDPTGHYGGKCGVAPGACLYNYNDGNVLHSCTYAYDELISYNPVLQDAYASNGSNCSHHDGLHVGFRRNDDDPLGLDDNA